MTEDTRKALEILKPVCDLLHMEIAADDRVMTIDKQKIGISYNSTYATVMEGIGYLFFTAYSSQFRRHLLSYETEDAITRYWVRPKESEGDASV